MGIDHRSSIEHRRSFLPPYNPFMRFTKMHGIGNDYVYVNGFEETVDDPAALAPVIADRHTGVGGDGLILLLPAEGEVDAHVRMRMFNADGSEAEMCGNGIRCLCKLAHDTGICTEKPMRIQTGYGVLSLDYTTGVDGQVDVVTVNMGEPTLELPDIPVDETKIDDQLDGLVYVSMGNPHAVDFIAEADLDSAAYPPAAIAWAATGSKFENHPAFPNRINYHHVTVHSRNEVTVIHWERGSGATLACGTGACAVCVAGVVSGRTDREITAHLPGGDLQLRWDEASNHVFMTGPAATVFEGEWPHFA